MAISTPGEARLLDAEGLERSLDLLGVEAADLWAVIGVETGGCGFEPDRRLKILFERHVFHRETQGRFSGDPRNENVSSPDRGGYTAPGVGSQYDRLARAMGLDEHAALLATSWGLGQVMGFNHGLVGHPSVEEMVAAMADSESVQLEAMAGYIVANRLDGALRTHDWARFARGYNGPRYRDNNYDTRLAAESERARRGRMPDLLVRTAQADLNFLGYDTHGIDGIVGRWTRSALNDYQRDNGLAATEQVDEATFALIEEDVDRLRDGLAVRKRARSG